MAAMGTRERIIDAAEQSIHEHGIAGATTKRIAQRAGCSEALLYKHFSSKETLFLAVLLERMPALAPALALLRDRAGQGDVAADLTAFAVTAVDFYTSVAPVASGMMADPSLMAGFRAMLAERRSGPHLPVLALAELLRDEQRAGRIDAGLDAVAAASMLLGACFHRASMSSFVDLPGETGEWAETLVATLLRR
ncbi:transcriptional regulator, TetR family [Nonomuraea pusilla]|uniref:Transcriptional regulator, TetR family n=2 Tax=Nonomuraea pusilla TaxID=46177 RepID=A0A1H7RTS2_9ACTN|nr:transcriptional regulator, TetR family [Nonomuraea pusilla]